MTQKAVKIGIIGGGLMGRELLALARRWDALIDHPVRPIISALADLSPEVRSWFETAGVPNIYSDYTELLNQSDIDVVYLAVPHNLHEEIYLATIAAGKDFLGEKPFGIDLVAAQKIIDAIKKKELFVRVSSELPFFPGAQAAFNYAKSGELGEIVEVKAGLLHSSDIDVNKPINWKRQVKYCGEIGVMGDLGMHVAHVPLRLGWKPETVYAMLDDIVKTRTNKNGEQVPCDTIDNAVLAIHAHSDSQDRKFPMFWEMKRIAPGESNTWYFNVVGMKGGTKFSTRYPQSFYRYSFNDGEQVWSEIQSGHKTNWPVITGGIFEFGFPDALLQMWAAYLAEREGKLGDRFACASIYEALESHQVFSAALKSHSNKSAVKVDQLNGS
jgi:predicted dehydrogenase